MAKKNSAKLFICSHPDSLVLYKNLIQIIRRYDKDIKIVLLKVNHPYFLKFDFEPYRKYFDEIIEFDFIHYEKNFLAGIQKALAFQKKLKRVKFALLANFETIDLFLYNSTWLPLNTLLYNLSKQKNIKNIIKLILRESEGSGTKINKIKTLMCALYSLPLKCYKVKVMETLGGKFAGFVYTDKTPGIFVKLVSPMKKVVSIFDQGEEKFLPYPVISNSTGAKVKKDIVIIFGDADIFQDYSEYLPSFQIFVEKLTAFFAAIENKYPNCKLYYKPHPVDKGQIMPGINVPRYDLLDNTTNAERLFDTYHKRIKAVYSFSSTSAIIGSFFGIPSYTFYRYLCNPSGLKKFDISFNQENLESKFLFHISNLKEIGKIDDLEDSKTYIDLENINDIYRKILNI